MKIYDKDGPFIAFDREEAATLSTALENVYFSLAQKYQGQDPEKFFDDVLNLKTRVKDFLIETRRIEKETRRIRRKMA
jgi:hypothetical protein